MVGFREKEWSGRRDLGRHRRIAGLAERLVVALARRLGLPLLAVAGEIDCRAVLRADIIALTHALGRVMRLEEDLEQLLVADPLRVEHHHHRLGMAGLAGAQLLIGRVRRLTTHIADGGDPHAGHRPEQPLGAPIAAKREIGDFRAFRIGTLERPLVDEMRFRRGDRLVPPRQRRAGLGHLQWLSLETEHLGPPLISGDDVVGGAATCKSVTRPYDAPLQLERWPSGLRRTPGTRVYGKPYRGFESLSLRQSGVLVRPSPSTYVR